MTSSPVLPRLRVLLGAVLALALAAPARAQAPDSATPAARPDSARGRPAVGGVFFSLGAARPDLEALNGSLGRQGYPELDEGGRLTGGGGYVTFGRVLVGGSGFAFRGDEVDEERRTTTLSGGYGVLDVGYAVVATERWRVVPMVGVGAGRIRLRIQNRGELSFDSVVANPRRDVELAGSAPLLHAALSVHRALPLERNGQRTTVGLQAGYTFGIGDTEWERGVDDGVSGGPEAPFEGPYVRVVFGHTLSRRTGAIFPALGALLPWARR